MKSETNYHLAFGSGPLKTERWYKEHVHCSRFTPTKGSLQGVAIWRVRFFSAKNALELLRGRKADAFSSWTYAKAPNGEVVRVEGEQSKEIAQEYARQQAEKEIASYLSRKDEADKPIWVREANLPLDDLYTVYQEHKFRRWDSTSGTMAADEQMYRRFRENMPHIRTLDDLVHSEDVCGAYSKKLDRMVKKNGEQYAVSVRNKNDGWLRGFLTILKERHPFYLPSTYNMGKVDARKSEGKVNKSRALDANEVAAFLRYVENTKVVGGATQARRRWWRYAFQLQLGTGCRISELLALTYRDVDAENRLVHVRREVAKGKRERYALLTDEGLKAFEYLRLAAGYDGTKDERVLPVTDATYRLRMGDWIRGCFGGKVWSTPHDLRRVYIRHLAFELQLTPNEVMTYAGAQWTTIEKYYHDKNNPVAQKSVLKAAARLRKLKEQESSES
jgi:integrase